MKKTVLWLLIALLAFGGILSGCSGEQTSTNGDGERMTISVAYPNADNATWKNDDYYKYITDQLNIDIDFQALSADSAAEKARIMISSGDMADITYCSFVFDEYVKYGQQGVVKALPEGWEEKYPNLGFSMAMTGILNKLKDAGAGEIYGLVRTMDAYHAFLDEFKQAYRDGKDVSEMMKNNDYISIDKYAVAYRKDWAEQLGIETDYIMEYDALIDMAKKFKEADLGGVGAENTIGIAVDYTEAPNLFITAFNSSYKFFHKDENGKYVCGLLEDSTTEGVKAYAEAYKTGIISPDFYTTKTQNLNALFCTQRAGMIFPKGEMTANRSLNTEFEKSNPGLKAEDCIGVAWVLSPDGKVHGRETVNYYGGYYLNPDMSDEKLDRILALADYISSDEGGPVAKLGVPDKDFKVENGEYIITRETDEDGNPINMSELYPSSAFFAYFINPQYKLVDTADPHAIKLADELLAAKRQHELDLLWNDVDRASYTADDYVKFNASYDVNNLFAEIVVSNEDVDTAWAKKRAEIAAAAESVVANMNAALVE